MVDIVVMRLNLIRTWLLDSCIYVLIIELLWRISLTEKLTLSQLETYNDRPCYHGFYGSAMSVALGLMLVIVLKSVLEDVFQEKYRIFRFIYESIRRTACDDSSRGELMVTIKEKGKVITGREGDVR